MRSKTPFQTASSSERQSLLKALNAMHELKAVV
jgi:hypothetical protein